MVMQDDMQENIERMRLQIDGLTLIREDLYQKRLLDKNRDPTYSTSVIVPPPPGPTIITTIDAEVHGIDSIESLTLCV